MWGLFAAGAGAGASAGSGHATIAYHVGAMLRLAYTLRVLWYRWFIPRRVVVCLLLPEVT